MKDKYHIHYNLKDHDHINWSTNEENLFCGEFSSEAAKYHRAMPQQWEDNQVHKYQQEQSYHSPSLLSMSSGNNHLHLHSSPSISPTSVPASDHIPFARREPSY